MLVLSRKPNQQIVIGGNIRVTVVGVRGNQVRLGIEAPDAVKVYREELCAPPPAPAAALRRRHPADPDGLGWEPSDECVGWPR